MIQLRTNRMRRTAGLFTTRRLLTMALLAVMLTVSACGPRMASPTDSADNSQLVVELPAIVLAVAEDGKMTPDAGPLADVITSLGVDLSSLALPADIVEKLVANGIQTIQLDNRRDALSVYINGNAFTALAWDRESLSALLNVLASTGNDLGEAGKLITLLPDLGFGLVLKLPGSTASAPLARLQAASTRSQNTLQAALASAPALDLTLNFAADGSYQLQGLNPFMLGMIPADALRQSPDTIASVNEMGIEGLSIMMRPTGIVIMVNGEALPYIRSADQAQLMSMISLLLNVFGGDSAAQNAGLIQQLLPSLMANGLRLSVNFGGS